MNQEELESTQSALQVYLTNIEDNSKEIDTEIQQLQERFYQEEECNRKIREGRKAIEELIKLKAGNLMSA
jgi:septation ring formation regulator EzrA